MTIATAQLNQTQKPTCVKKSTPVKKVRGKDAVPFDEMERLMNVYGGIKALRNRGAPKKGNAEQGGNDKKASVKKDSIKRKFYRWFPDFDERFSRDENGRYQPVHGHEYEMKYRQEMRHKSMNDVSAKRSDAITKRNYERKSNVDEGKVANKSCSALSRQVSSGSSSNGNSHVSDKNIETDISIEIPDDIEIDTSHLVWSSTTAQSENKNSFFFDGGNRAPSPLSFQQQPTEKTVPEERDAAFSFVSLGNEEVTASEMKNLKQTIFDEVDEKFYGEAMSITHVYEPAPIVNAYEAYLSDTFSDESVEGSLGVVSNSTSSINSSHDLDGQWGSDSDIEDCLFLGMGYEFPSTRLTA